MELHYLSQIIPCSFSQLLRVDQPISVPFLPSILHFQPTMQELNLNELSQIKNSNWHNKNSFLE